MLKDQIVEEKLMGLIIDGHYEVNSKLEPERILAETYECSRPVIHRAIMRLEEKGLVQVRPRKGVMVLDYLIHGKLSLVEHIVAKKKDQISLSMTHNMLTFIRDNLKSVVRLYAHIDRKSYSSDLISGLDFYDYLSDFARGCGNDLYSMLFNEFMEGFINVGQVLVDKEDAKVSLRSIDQLSVDKKIVEALLQVDYFFSLIEKYWIGGLHV